MKHMSHSEGSEDKLITFFPPLPVGRLHITVLIQKTGKTTTVTRELSVRSHPDALVFLQLPSARSGQAVLQW